MHSQRLVHCFYVYRIESNIIWRWFQLVCKATWSLAAVPIIVNWNCTSWSMFQLFICDQVLEEEGVHGHVAIDELELDLVPLDRDIMSLELPDFYRQFYLVCYPFLAQRGRNCICHRCMYIHVRRSVAFEWRHTCVYVPARRSNLRTHSCPVIAPHPAIFRSHTARLRRRQMC